jgi:septum formation protein
LTLSERAKEFTAVVQTPFILASASPRRRSLLSDAGYEFTVAPADIDERFADGEPPDEAVVRVAVEKALAVRARVGAASVVLAADTCVVTPAGVLGKPRDFDDAMRMLDLLSGRNHRVFTGWVVLPPGAPAELALVGVSSSTVRMREIALREAAAYAGSAEPYDKAGAYAVQGQGRRFIAAVIGPLDNVIGLPLTPVAAALARCGVAPVAVGSR